MDCVLNAKRIGTFVAVFAVMGSPLAAANFYQTGYDGARTRTSPERGPSWTDVAIDLDVPGMVSDDGPPVIVGGNVYFTTNYVKWKGEVLNQHGLWRLNLSRGIPERVLELDALHIDTELGLAGDVTGQNNNTLDFRNAIATDGERIFVTGHRGVIAYDVTLGRAVWEWRPEQLQMRRDHLFCVAPAVDAGRVFVACVWHHGLVEDEDVDTEHRTFVVSLDAKAGRVLATWWNPAIADEAPLLAPAVANAHQRRLTVWQLAVVGDVVLVVLLRNEQWFSGHFSANLTALHARNLTFLWNRTYDASDYLRDWFAPSFQKRTYGWGNFGPYPSAPTGNRSELLFRFFDIDRLDPRTGARLRAPLRVEDDPEYPAPANGVVLDGDVLYAASSTQLARYDPPYTRQTWMQPKPAGSPDSSVYEAWHYDGFLVADDVLYARSDTFEHKITNPDTTYNHVWGKLISSTVHAIDKASGTILWNRTFTPRVEIMWGNYSGFYVPFSMAASDGVLALGGIDGTMRVMGTTDAGIQVQVDASTRFPRLGEIVTVDLARTTAGSHGRPTEFGVAWNGDEPPTWQSSPEFSRRFNESRIVESRFYARNPAGQESSVVLAFEVGGSPPPIEAAPQEVARSPEAMTPFQRFFAKENGATPWILVGALLVFGAASFLLAGAVLAARREPVEVPRYEIVRELGHGAFGRTFLAQDSVLDRRVVLKQPTAPWLLQRESRERFLREARLLAKVHHPNVVDVYEILTKERPPSLVLEYVEGSSLEERLAHEGRLALADAVRVAQDALRGLRHIHEAGIVHRDVKPANILIDLKGTAKVSDFGIAHSTHNAAHVTLATQGYQPGSPLYMSPEQARGEEVDARSDLYSMGAVLYEMLTGRHYLGAKDQPEFRVRQWIEEETPELPSRGVPAGVIAVLEKALSKNPKARFAAADEMSEALEKAAWTASPSTNGAQRAPAIAKTIVPTR